MSKSQFPQPPYPYRSGMEWKMNKDCVFVYDNGKPVMAISISEIICDQKKLPSAENSKAGNK